jgi:predicted Zn-dependent protease
MNKMTAFMLMQNPKEIEADEQGSEKEVSEVNEDSIMDYLSSHPKTEERVEQAEKFSKCYKEGRTDCPL